MTDTTKTFKEAIGSKSKGDRAGQLRRARARKRSAAGRVTPPSETGVTPPSDDVLAIGDASTQVRGGYRVVKDQWSMFARCGHCDGIFDSEIAVTHVKTCASAEEKDTPLALTSHGMSVGQKDGKWAISCDHGFWDTARYESAREAVEAGRQRIIR